MATVGASSDDTVSHPSESSSSSSTPTPRGVSPAQALGWEFTWQGRPQDGMRVESTLFSADRKAQVTLPSHFWSKHSI